MCSVLPVGSETPARKPIGITAAPNSLLISCKAAASSYTSNDECEPTKNLRDDDPSKQSTILQSPIHQPRIGFIQVPRSLTYCFHLQKFYPSFHPKKTLGMTKNHNALPSAFARIIGRSELGLSRVLQIAAVDVGSTPQILETFQL